MRAGDVRPRIGTILDDIQRSIAFGIGRTSGQNVDHPIFDDPTWRDIRPVGKLKQMAQQQLGTVGSGNHFVDLLEDEDGWLWVSAHFGSRGLGHRTASGYLNLAAGRAFDDRAPGESMDQPATVLSLRTPGPGVPAGHGARGQIRLRWTRLRGWPGARQPGAQLD